MKEQNNTKQQQQAEGSISIPREYVLEGVKESVKGMYQMMRDARKKYGNRYNEKNDYEECDRRFRLNDTEATLKEYDLIMAKQSKQPSVIRKVIKQIGDNAINYGIRKYLSEQQQKQEEEKEKED